MSYSVSSLVSVAPLTTPCAGVSLLANAKQENALVFLELINIPQIRYPREGKQFSSNSADSPPTVSYPNFDAPRLSPASASGKIPPFAGSIIRDAITRRRARLVKMSLDT